MTFAGINYLAVLIAAAVSFGSGAVWYRALGTSWMTAAGLTPSQVNPSPAVYLVTAACQLIMAFMLAGVIGHLGRDGIVNAMITAAFLWFGFVVTSMTVNHRFQGKSWGLTVIDGGYWLTALLIQGAIIGGIGI